MLDGNSQGGCHQPQKVLLQECFMEFLRPIIQKQVILHLVKTLALNKKILPGKKKNREESWHIHRKVT